VTAALRRIVTLGLAAGQAQKLRPAVLRHQQHQPVQVAPIVVDLALDLLADVAHVGLGRVALVEMAGAGRLVHGVANRRRTAGFHPGGP
jgi:hypothetical protein